MNMEKEDEKKIDNNIKLSDRLTQLSRLTEAIKAEFDLIGMRVGWLSASEAFIFAAFATIVSNYNSDMHFACAAKYMAVALPILGVLLALVVAFSVYAAHSAADRLKRLRDEFINSLPEEIRITLISVDDIEHKRGNIPSKAIPILIVCVWLGALLSLLRP
jgi:hypothetical protein